MGTRDTSLSENAPDTNLGTSTTLLIDGDDPGGTGKDLTALIRWDISSIPSGSDVTTATITIRITNASPNTYQIYELKRDWVETEATWNVSSAGVAWEVPGARGSTDRGTTVLGTILASSTGTATITLNSAGIAVVQSWINNSSSNFGLIFANSSNADGLDFGSSENSTLSYRPMLTVSYTPSATNQPPSVNAGPDQSVFLPNPATLDGTVSDDGLPNPPGAVTVTWIAVSGPGQVTFANPQAVDTAATFSATGVYTLRLTASDGELSAADDAVITVSTATSNSPPVSDNQMVTTLEDTVTTITLSAHDPEGQPLTYSIVTPPSHGAVNLSGTKAVYTPNANYNGQDSFAFKANDGALDSNVATVSITITPVNDPPTASFTANPTSGAPPLTVNFDATASSDVDGTIASYSWDFGDSTTGSGVTISHQYTVEGTYTAKLTVSDNAAATGTTTSSIVVTSNVRFAVIGDYGSDTSNENRVANLVKGWKPAFVVTVGDNNYPKGEASTVDRNIGKYYHDYIGNYKGSYGAGSSTNRFWPSLGNHDWDVGDKPYIDYFTLPNNERYYQVVLGNGLVHLFAIDSDSHEPDGRTSTSIQANWLRNALAASTSCFDVVYFHHPAYTTGSTGSTTDMRWPFGSWGADVVLAGHAHVYERLDASGFPYFVDGLGGESIASFGSTGGLPSGVKPVVRYNADYGAMLVTAKPDGITYEFYNANGVRIDTYTKSKTCATGNQPPAVNAGPDQFVTYPNPASLHGTVSDDGLPNPPGTATVTWSVVSGPGTVTFSDRNSLDTSADFSSLGTYTLRLTASDGELASSDDVGITVDSTVSVSFQDAVSPAVSYAGTRDTTLSQNAPDTNLGASNTLLVDGDDPGGTGKDLATLIKWDASTIPAGSVVESAAITLTISNSSSNTYQIYELKRDWQEGAATWNVTSSGVNWQVPGAQGTSDRGSTVLGSILATATGQATITLNNAGIALVQSWVNNPSSNFGIILANSSNTDGLDFGSREQSTLSSRPKLTIRYQP
ncbi:MAG: DNRLRE domain-containing protein [Acidobacteriia bacterium]|nr:DNRLRE domain-containing protein [Terriglobia bacterium]